jgi:hypothetical protein
MLLAPLLSLSKNQNTLSLCLLLFLSSLFYGIAAHAIQEKLLAFSSLCFLLLSFLAMCSYFSFHVHSFMLVSVLMAQIFLYIPILTKNTCHEIWHQALIKNGYISYAIFCFLFLAIPHASLYYPIALSLISAILFLFLYFFTQKHLALAAISFFLSYYATLFSWSIYVWEFYTIPLGMFFLLLGYILEKSNKQSDAHNDCFLLGILLILLPTLFQSYSGWFDHLAPLGISPYKHLYHSLFLSIESIILILYGTIQKRLIFFFSGLLFLLSDICLLLFAYVNLGIIPQAIWWASLGFLLILTGWLLEYRRETLKCLFSSITKHCQNSFLELKTWQ